MTVDVINVTRDELVADRATLLAQLGLTHDELRRRVIREAATVEERDALDRLDEIAFLLGEWA
ncbi:hypothetical protein LY13_004532 [Prauserella aidingensis]|uniref:hypothetical protein n=1 Tax=Prauserella aidingensis TaxID=387890 RepID=UPI0020A450C4|nr:hypothetical protein [Prauserella aidingensis]MCP2255750.1 hypothetical protein [Prauserella aidingensis]